MGDQRGLEHFVGLDPGRSQDFTALAVLERPRVFAGHPPSSRPPYALRHLARWPPGTAYTEVVREVARLLRTPPLAGALLAVDRTGVGSAVVDLLADGLRSCPPCTFWPITLTAGHGVTAGEAGLCLPKKELAGTLQVLLQTRRLQVARALPQAALLVREMEDFRFKVAAARPETLESWREGQHDDLVFAVGLAAWLGEQALPDPYDGTEETTVTRFLLA